MDIACVAVAPALKRKGQLEGRLGRIREPMNNMRCLAIKVTSEDMTEARIRMNNAFLGREIESVRYYENPLK